MKEANIAFMKHSGGGLAPTCNFSHNVVNVPIQTFIIKFKPLQHYISMCYCKATVTFRVLYINNSLHLARKYARIFVRGHYLFREAKSFPRA